MTTPKTKTPAPIPNICEVIFQQALAYLEDGSTAAGYQSMLNGITCLYEHGSLSKRDFKRAIKMFKTLQDAEIAEERKPK